MQAVEARRPFSFVAALGLIAAVLVCVGWRGWTVARGQDRFAQAGVAKAGHRKRPTRRIRLTVEVNGDILVHSPVWQQALVDGHGRYDFAPMLREIRPYIQSADGTIAMSRPSARPVRPPRRRKQGCRSGGAIRGCA
jgi:hypothetical protein